MRSLKGFTLIQLMVVMAVTTILLTTGIPNLYGFVQNNRMTAGLNEFVSALNLARSEAIKRGSRVTLCKSPDGATCKDSGDWSQGWLVFSDPNNNSDYDTGDDLLRVHQGLADDNASLTGNFFLRNYIAYLANGFSHQSGTFVLCDARGFEHARAVVINRTGRANSMPASESSVEDCNAGR